MRFVAVAGIALALAAAGCRQTSDAQPTAPPGESEAEAANEGAPEAPVSGQARSVKEENERYVFNYAYPAAADAIPALKARLDADLARQRAELAADAREAAEDARQNGYPYHPYSRSRDWKVVAELPGWLSLSTIVGTYTGGAHPNYVFDAILWDKAANSQRNALDLFTSRPALSEALREDFCAAIDRQREEKRGEPIKRGSDQMFAECLDPLSYTVILGSAGGTAFDRIGILVPPYEAGPYAEGSYEVTLLVTRRVLALVKPEFRESFALGR